MRCIWHDSQSPIVSSISLNLIVKSRLKLFQDQTSTKQFRPATQCSTILLNLLKDKKFQTMRWISNQNLTRHLDRQTFGQTDIWTDRHLASQPASQPARQTDRWTNRLTDTVIPIYKQKTLFAGENVNKLLY